MELLPGKLIAGHGLRAGVFWQNSFFGILLGEISGLDGRFDPGSTRKWLN
jgi:hypothetical protein